MISRQLCTKVNTISNVQISTLIRYQLFLSIIDRIISMSSTAISFLCEAYKRGLTWPKYAWILHSYRLDDLLRSSKSDNRCTHSVQKILEGALSFS